MASSLEELEESAPALSPEDRAIFAEVEAQWEQEVVRRLAEIEAGTAKLIYRAEFQERMQARVGRP